MPLPEVEWKKTVPALIERYADAWDLVLGDPYDGGTASWVAPAKTPDGLDAVLKLSLPHREARGEATALRWWAGDGAIRLFRDDPEHYALLIERCEPGDRLTESTLPAETRLRIAGELLAELWDRGVPNGSDLELVADVTAEWADLVEERMRQFTPGYDSGLVAYGVDLLRGLPQSAGREVIIHGDFNPGNVLSATREPWLVIDPKPMIGDPGYDLCPLLMQVDDPFCHADPIPVLSARVELLAEVVGEPSDRILAWSAARMIESALWYVSRGEFDAGAREVDRARSVADLLQR